MKYTLLEMVQDILSSMDSDEVNSISDNSEAQQVARVIRNCYFEINNAPLASERQIYQLESSNDVTKPVLMTRPSDVHNITILKYNKADTYNPDPRMEEVIPLSLDEFFRITHSLTLSDTNVFSMDHVIDGNSFGFLYRNDKAPTYYTSVDEHTFFFDSFDARIDTTLQKAKTFCVGEKEKSFQLVDTYVIDLDEQQHVWLLNEAKAMAFAEMKQAQHPMAIANARRARVKSQKTKNVLNDPWLMYQRLPNYGKRTHGSNSKYHSNVIMH